MFVSTVHQYSPMRAAFGLADFRNKRSEALYVANQEEVAALVKATNPWALMLPGLGYIFVILWLMIFKPF